MPRDRITLWSKPTAEEALENLAGCCECRRCKANAESLRQKDRARNRVIPISACPSKSCPAAALFFWRNIWILC